MELITIRLFTFADALGLTDPDVAWLPPFWSYKAAVLFGVV